MQLRGAILLSLFAHVGMFGLGADWLGTGSPPSQPVLTVYVPIGPTLVHGADRPQQAPDEVSPSAARRSPSSVKTKPTMAKSVPALGPAPASKATPRDMAPASQVMTEIVPVGPAQTVETVRAGETGGASPESADQVSAGGADVAPSWPGYLANPKPEMPLASRQRGEQGRVVLKVRVGRDGRPQTVDVVHSSGFARLDEAARKIVAARWRFNAARRGDVPIDADVNVPIVFRLDD